MAKEEQKQATPKKKTTYLRNKDLLAEVIKCRETGEMSDTLARMLQLLVAKYGKSAQFGSYTYNDDMQSWAMLNLCKIWMKFDPAKSDNPFAYYTQTIKNSFRQYLNREKIQRVVRDELLVDKGLNPSFTYMSDYEADNHYVHDEEDHNQTVNDMKSINDNLSSEEDFIS